MIRPTPTFISQPLNSSTYLVVHNDRYLEFPSIYVKLYRKFHLAVVIDTGSGKDYGKGYRGSRELREFIELKIIGGEGRHDATTSDLKTTRSASAYHFVVICTHCHFDHIGGIEPFARAGASIMASGHDRDFLAPSNLPTNSLCEAFGMPTPEYKITHFLADGEKSLWRGHDLSLRAIHTPGHTPDSLAIYDSHERWLFTGDTCYRRIARLPWGEEQDVPIVFPAQGNWEEWKATLSRLRSLVDEVETTGSGREGKMRIACGHTTSDSLAGELLDRVMMFAARVERGEVPVIARLRGDEVAPGGSLGDEMFVFWQDEGDPEFSLVAPERFEKDFKRDWSRCS